MWIQYTGSGLLGVPAGIKIGHQLLTLGEKQFLNHERFGDDAIVVFVDATKELHLATAIVKLDEGIDEFGVPVTGSAAWEDNTNDLDEYLSRISENKSPVSGSEAITGEEALSEAIFLGLRKTSGINIESFSKRYCINLLSRYSKEIKQLQEAGLIEIVCSACSYETDLRLTRKGLLLSNEIFTKFL